MKLPDTLYDVLKWLSLVALDAVGIAYEALSGVWGLPLGTEISKTCVILSVLIGTLIGVTSANYNKSNVVEFEKYKALMDKHNLDIASLEEIIENRAEA